MTVPYRMRGLQDHLSDTQGYIDTVEFVVAAALRPYGDAGAVISAMHPPHGLLRHTRGRYQGRHGDAHNLVRRD